MTFLATLTLPEGHQSIMDGQRNDSLVDEGEQGIDEDLALPEHLLEADPGEQEMGDGLVC